MPYEARSRITVLLPLPIADAQHIFLDIVLTQLTQFCGGLTTTPTSWSGRDTRPPIEGRWINPNTGEPEVDPNILIFADAPVTPDDETLQAYLERLKLRCQEELRQDIIWITIHQVDRVATADPVR